MNTTTDTPPVAAPQEPQKPIRPIIGILAIVLAVAALIAFFVLGTKRSAPEFVYQRVTPIGEVAVRADGAPVDAAALGVDGQVVEYLETDAAQFALVRTLAATSSDGVPPNPFIYDVYLAGDAPRALTTDGERKAGLAVSADGSKVAYAHRRSDIPEALIEASGASWQVAVVDTATGAVTELGEGVAPQLVTEDDGTLVLFSSRDGVVIRNLANDAMTLATSLLPAGVMTEIDVSPDGEHLMFRDTVNGRYSVFRVSSFLPTLVVAPVGQIPMGLKHAALGTDQVYALRALDTGYVEQLAFPLSRLDAPARAQKSFAPELGIDRITIQN